MGSEHDAILFFEGRYAFLSNFHPSPIRWHGRLYATVEHAYQSAKAISRAERNAIAAAKTPGEAKRMGQKVRLRTDWEQVKVPIMTDLVNRKFRQNDLLAQKLIETGDVQIYEGNTWNDTIWGVCRNSAGLWMGKNLLGIILMEVRNKLRATAADVRP